VAGGILAIAWQMIQQNPVQKGTIILISPLRGFALSRETMIRSISTFA
jgi:hypothetical protein